MSTTTSKGYLEFSYLDTPYLGGEIYLAHQAQVSRMIANNPHAAKAQVERVISATHLVKQEVERLINQGHTVPMQAYRVTGDQHLVNIQVNCVTTNAKVTHTQTTKTIDGEHLVSSETKRYIEDLNHNVKTEIDRFIEDRKINTNMEIRRGVNTHEVCDTYLVDSYLSKSYLAPRYCVQMRMQIERILGVQDRTMMQVERVIADRLHSVNEQTKRRIDKLKLTGMQVNRIQARVLHMQVIQALYNVTNLRILSEFASRGNTGLNWTANSTLAGDFSINNVNTDIDEQVWRSNGVTSGLILTCDSQVSQGVFVDTLAIRNHNLTTSASVVFQGSIDPSFSTVGFSETLFMKRTNSYWVSPTLPLTSYRYWRFLISDPTNTNPDIQIGTILFGSAQIMSGECFVDNVVKTTKHFSDKVKTEGFTNVSNDRALKFATSLDFRSLNFKRANYTLLRNLFDSARTTLKCLWIPTPQYPERFAVFGKLKEIPPENHNNKGEDADYISFGVEVDESL